MTRTSDPFHNLADAASEDVVAASAAALAAETEQDRGAGDAFALDFDRIVTRAERQARWRRFTQRLRALAAALAWRPSWRPVLATVAGLAVIVVTGDVFLNARLQRPTIPVASTSVEEQRAPQADTLTHRLALGDEQGAEEKPFAGAPASPAPPPPPASGIVDAPKPVRTVPIHPRAAASNPQPAQAAPPASAPAPRTASALADYQRAVEQKAASAQPPNAASATAEPAPASAAESGGLASPSFIWPLRGELIAGFGAVTKGRHNDGIDIAVPAGTDIHAADDGVVVYVGDELKSYGNLILLRHSDGFVTAYAHADKILVKLNDVVHRGQVIAKSGVTGAVALLHFEIRKGSTAVDPAQYLPKE